jgi:hypothetical protein
MTTPYETSKPYGSSQYGAPAKNGAEKTDLKDKVASAVGAMKEQVSSVAAAAKDEANTLIEPMKEKAMEMAEEQRKTGAVEVGRVAKAVQAVAGEIEKEIPQAAGYIRSAAEGLEQASSAIQNRSVGELVEFVETFARRNPAAFFGTSVLAGFVLSRFLKSTGERRPARGA